MNVSLLTETLGRELRHAVRMLRKNKVFSAIAVLSLALGIAVNTTMFSVVNAVLLRQVPLPEPSRLVRVVQQRTRGDVTVAEYEFLKDHGRVFASVAAFRGGGERRLDGGGVRSWVTALTVSADFLRTLRIKPALGREFSSEETRVGGPQAVVISDGVWRTTFGGDSRVLGQTVTLNNDAFTLVGVLPADFWFHQPTDVLVPLRPSGGLSDLGTNTQIVGRLRDDVVLSQAQGQVGMMTDDLRRAQGGNVSRDYRGLLLLSYRDWLVGNIRPNLILLFAATGVLLLITGANVAMLILTRTAGRSREIAVRLALGGERRILLQFLTEHLVLAALGAVGGMVATFALVKAFVAWIPFHLPASAPIQVNVQVLVFAVVLCFATAVLFTLVPLFATRRLDVQGSLRSEGRTVGTGMVRGGTRNVLVVSEVALSTTLLVASALLFQSLYRLHQEPLGFAPDGLVVFETPFAPERASNAADRMNFTRVLLEHLEAMPGVQGAAATTLLPLTGQSNLPTQHEGRPEHSIGGMEVRPVTPRYFDIMGIPIRRGRSFVDSDSVTARPLVVVNETVARAWWPDGEPLGDYVRIGRFQGKEFLKDAPREVIGVVGDTKAVIRQAPPRPTVFVPMTAAFGGASLSWIVKAEGAADFGGRLRSVVASIDPDQRIRRLRTMNDIVAATSATSRFNATLFGSFAGLALLLAALGLYGVLSHLVTQRRQEIGTRMALGASRSNVLAAFLKHGVGLAVVGLCIGVAGALTASRWLSSLLFGVQATDASSFVAVCVVLLAVAFAASYIPARRAAGIDPMMAIRSE